MSRFLIGFATGGLFGAGLLVSGMTRPSKVLGFLDLAGAWDPSLMIVMAGAVIVFAIGYRLVVRREAPLLAPRFDLAAGREIDRRLIAGAALFGVGWGLAGFCPGPSLVAAGSGSLGALIFVAAMTAGMLLQSRTAVR